MMSVKKKFLFPALGFLALSIVACGGGGGSSSSGGSSVVPAPQKIAVKLVLHVPTRIGQMTPKLRARMNQAQNTEGLDVAVYPNPNTTTSPLTTQNYDISGGSTLCSTNPTDLSRTCNLSINLDPGSYVFNLASYDQAPVGGVQTSGNNIGIGSTIVTVTAQQANTVNVSINGVASSVAVSLPIPVIKPLASLTQNAIVSVLDTDNEVIVSPNYVDTAGNPVTVNMSVIPGASNLTLGTTSFSSPPPSGIPVIYNPAGLTATSMLSSQNWVINATLSSNSAVGSGSLAAPAALSSFALAAPGYGITNEGNNYIWVTEPSANNIQKMDPRANVVAPAISVAASSAPLGPTPGPRDIIYIPQDGMLWMTNSNTPALTLISDTGTGELGVPLSSYANSIASDNTNVWTAEPGAALVAKIGITPIAVNENGLTAGEMPNSVAQTQNYTYLTATQSGSGLMTAMNGGSFNLATFAAGTGPSGIGTSPGTNTMFVLDGTANQMLVSSGAGPAQTFTAYAINATASDVVYGPDANGWYDYTSPNPKICQISTTGAQACYPLPAGTVPGQMAVFYNQIWIVDSSNAILYALNL